MSTGYMKKNFHFIFHIVIVYQTYVLGEPQIQEVGKVLFVKQNIETISIDLEHCYNDFIFEVTAILITNLKVIVATLYRTPD